MPRTKARKRTGDRRLIFHREFRSSCSGSKLIIRVAFPEDHKSVRRALPFSFPEMAEVDLMLQPSDCIWMKRDVLSRERY